MKRSIVLFAVLSCAAFAAVANVGRLGQILQEQREIRAETERPTGAYARFDRNQIDKMQRAQDRIFRLLDGVDQVEQLDREKQVELFNSLEEVKAVLAANENDRQICRRERKTGTTLREVRCATVGERTKLTNEARDWKGDSGVCAPESGSTSCGSARP
ncbi:hypothetical protein [Lysobacter silvisoli]|uniref:Uncharacterized protein n=1 Tax=Lysobacter silvisoli TaxID=2293254 RepID=A0A371JYN3_9GAMM|nr:hypothetical protein [Lysobacter silvisoli]RDZ26783.1 hypothetical protein DX914_17595 [Lysobacter silvisoli]